MTYKAKKTSMTRSLLTAGILLGAGAMAERHFDVSERARAFYDGLRPVAASPLESLPDSTAYRLISERSQSLEEPYRRALVGDLVR